MMVKLENFKYIQEIKPSIIATYLLSKGWESEGQIDKKFEIFSNKTNEEILDIKLPLNQNFKDYPFRLSELFETLEEFEKRPKFKIITEIIVFPSDIVRIRLPTTDVSRGLVSLENGSCFVNFIKEMMLAAACSVVDPRPFYPSKKPKEATQFIENAKMAQSEEGSYIIPIISQISKVKEEQKKITNQEPFERRAIKRLANGLNEINNASEKYLLSNKLEIFNESVANGVSANLIDSVIGIGRLSKDTPCFEVFFSWTQLDDFNNSDLPEIIEMKNSYIPILEKASEFLKEFNPIEEFKVVGPVIRLARTEKSENGKITIVSDIENENRFVTIELIGREYHQAVIAHDRQSRIRCSGRLKKEGKNYYLDNPENFEIESRSFDITLDKWSME